MRATVSILTNTAPKVIIYDNGCNLHNYCLNREPTHFKESWFLVDRLHWANHTGIALTNALKPINPGHVTQLIYMHALPKH